MTKELVPTGISGDYSQLAFVEDQHEQRAMLRQAKENEMYELAGKVQAGTATGAETIKVTNYLAQLVAEGYN